ncbi:pyridoxamine 5'-phosphate oxidase family protein [Thermogemmatispora sp.]|uniref:pyridoxamine 5'-phosphate oxidase family protein n=1 Tax=Thermogemmatispora sp. TaxID=1968838 RepID=UPI0035E44A09
MDAQDAARLRAAINEFLARYDTLAIATEDNGQPYVTRVFYVEEPLSEERNSLTLYCTFILTSRKLANLRRNPRVGIFIGPGEPTAWLEATAEARLINDEQASATVRERLIRKSPAAASFIARLPVQAIALEVRWLRITDLTELPRQSEATFPLESGPVGPTTF